MSATVQGYCPSCGGESLFLGSGGYVTCSRDDCTRPDAASDILHDPEIHHIVQLDETTFTVHVCQAGTACMASVTSESGRWSVMSEVHTGIVPAARRRTGRGEQS